LAARRLASAPAKVHSPCWQTGGRCLPAFTAGVSRRGMTGWQPRCSHSDRRRGPGSRRCMFGRGTIGRRLKSVGRQWLSPRVLSLQRGLRAPAPPAGPPPRRVGMRPRHTWQPACARLNPGGGPSRRPRAACLGRTLSGSPGHRSGARPRPAGSRPVRRIPTRRRDEPGVQAHRRSNHRVRARSFAEPLQVGAGGWPARGAVSTWEDVQP
jgi:hypothetical protein